MPPPPRPWEAGAGPKSSVSAPVATTSSSIGEGTSNAASSPALPPPPQTTTRLGTSTTLARTGYGGTSTGYGYGGMGGYGGGYGMGMGGYGMGGMGLGGYGMGMGYGMGGMYGGSEMEQRGQMALMVIGRVVEMFHAFTNVMHMTIGSATQFMGSYIGLSQQYQQLSAPPLGPDGLPLTVNEEGQLINEQGQLIQASPQKPSLTAALLGLVKKLLIIAFALFIASRIHKLFSKPKPITDADLEHAFNNAVASQASQAPTMAAANVPPSVSPYGVGMPMGMGMGMGMGYGRGAYNAFGYSPGGLNYGMNY